MTERDTLKKLIDDGAVVATLRKGSTAQHAIAALQMLLHWLGFDNIKNIDSHRLEGLNSQIPALLKGLDEVLEKP